MSKNDFETPLYSLEEVDAHERPEPPKHEYSVEYSSRLQRLVHRINVSHTASVTVSLVMSLVSMIFVGCVFFFSNSIPMETRILVMSLWGVFMISLLIMLVIYWKDPVISIHFASPLMFVNGIGVALSSMHLYYK